MGMCVSSISAADIEESGLSKEPKACNNNHGTHDIVVHFKDSNVIKSYTAIDTVGSLYSQQGTKGFNQDTAILYQGYGAEDGVLVGVFDGHGMNGHIVSKAVRDRLPSLILNRKNALPADKNITSHDLVSSNNCHDGKAGDECLDYEEAHDHNDDGNDVAADDEWKSAYISSFKAMDKEIKLLENVDCSLSGTTAVVAVKQGDELVIANLGDSRAILGTESENGMIIATQLTTDLKPCLQVEADRIRKSNGRVFALEQEPHIQRVWLPDEQCPGLAMSRAFGDFDLKDHGVISTPRVSKYHLSSNDQFLLLATDGVWDVLSNEDVVSVVCSAKSEETAAKAVVQEARAAWKRRFPSAKVDDITAVCIFLQRGRKRRKPE